MGKAGCQAAYLGAFAAAVAEGAPRAPPPPRAPSAERVRRRCRPSAEAAPPPGAAALESARRLAIEKIALGQPAPAAVLTADNVRFSYANFVAPGNHYFYFVEG